ncbi:MAG: hypothetical protein ACLGH8_11245 [Bacteroidia bacterium]
MKKIALLIALLATGFSFAQSEIINNYKYVIIPRKFDFFKDADRYKANTLTKMAFEKAGFKAFFNDEQLPQEIALNRCHALYGDIDNMSGLLTTSVSILIKDCNGKELYRTEKGRSKQKDFDASYREAIREAAASLIKINYVYVGDEAAANYFGQPVTYVPQPAAATAPATQVPVNKEEVVNQNTLFAQPIANGYQLVDSTPKVVLKMYRTSQPDSYSASGDGKNGVVFKKGNDWFFEYYVNDKLVSEKLSIKF